jgi:hypothetical protein
MILYKGEFLFIYKYYITAGINYIIHTFEKGAGFSNPVPALIRYGNPCTRRFNVKPGIKKSIFRNKKATLHAGWLSI